MEKSSQKDSDKMNQVPEPIRGETGASIMGPRNVRLRLENPDQLASPYTDSRTIPNLKFSFATARNRLVTGGWAREVTVRELPVATELTADGGSRAEARSSISRSVQCLTASRSR